GSRTGDSVAGSPPHAWRSSRKEACHRVSYAFHLGVGQIGMHRQREHLRGCTFGIGKRRRLANGSEPGALTMDRRRIVNGGVNLVGAEVGLERVATSRTDHVLMVDGDPARVRGRGGGEGGEAATVVPGDGAASAVGGGGQ